MVSGSIFRPGPPSRFTLILHPPATLGWGRSDKVTSIFANSTTLLGTTSTAYLRAPCGSPADRRDRWERFASDAPLARFCRRQLGFAAFPLLPGHYASSAARLLCPRATSACARMRSRAHMRACMRFVWPRCGAGGGPRWGSYNPPPALPPHTSRTSPIMLALDPTRPYDLGRQV